MVVALRRSACVMQLLSAQIDRRLGGFGDACWHLTPLGAHNSGGLGWTRAVSLSDKDKASTDRSRDSIKPAAEDLWPRRRNHI